MTLDDLARFDGNAELIGGRVIPQVATGFRPQIIAANIYVSLRAYAKTVRRGLAFTDGMGFAVPELTSGRESFTPDAAYYDGPRPANRMKFITGTPVDVRPWYDVGPDAERTLAAKRADYFEAGTLVVWDVDPEVNRVAMYRGDNPDQPVIFEGNQTADAEPAVPGWRITLAEVFEDDQFDS